ncbi:MAG: hypothetical protein U0R26_10690 [Solirubrobacterales bacterium]
MKSVSSFPVDSVLTAPTAKQAITRTAETAPQRRPAETITAPIRSAGPADAVTKLRALSRSLPVTSRNRSARTTFESASASASAIPGAISGGRDESDGAAARVRKCLRSPTAVAVANPDSPDQDGHQPEEVGKGPVRVSDQPAPRSRVVAARPEPWMA